MSDGMAPEKGERYWRERYRIVLEERDKLKSQGGVMSDGMTPLLDTIEQSERYWREQYTTLLAERDAAVSMGTQLERERDKLRTQLAECERMRDMRCRQAIEARTAQCKQIDESSRLRAELDQVCYCLGLDRGTTADVARELERRQLGEIQVQTELRAHLAEAREAIRDVLPDPNEHRYEYPAFVREATWNAKLARLRRVMEERWLLT